MKILLITFLYDPQLGGGAALSVYSLAHELKKRGHEITVVTSIPDKKTKTYIEDGIKIISFYPPNLYWVYEKDQHPRWQKAIWQLIDLWNPFVYGIVKKIILEEKPDIVHVHKLRGFSPSVWNAAYSAGVRKIIQTCHDYEAISPQGTLAGVTGRLIAKRSWLVELYQSVRRKASQKVTIFTTPGKVIASEIKAFRFFPNAGAFVVPNSHGFTAQEIDANSRASIQKESPGFKILFMARLETEKGIWVLCEAVERLVKEGLDMNLLIAGTGSQEAQLKNRFTDKKVFQFQGYVEGQMKAQLYQECDIVATPSLWPETFCITAIEALAFGKPVLASPIGELPNLIQKGKTGFFSAAGDIESLEVEIKRIILHRAELHAMRANCFETAKIYTPEKITDQYMALYTMQGNQ